VWTLTSETLPTYDGTVVSWQGSQYVAPDGTPNNMGETFPVKVSQQYIANGSVFAEYTRPAGSPTQAFLRAVTTPTGGSTSGTLALASGWNQIAWPGVWTTDPNWSNPSSNNIGWVSAVTTDIDVHVNIQAKTGNLTSGTVLALFINNVEACRVTADGTQPVLNLMCDLHILGGQTLDVRVNSPAAQNLNTIAQYSYATTPAFRIVNTKAIPSGGGAWQATVAGHFLVSAGLAPSTASFGQQWFLQRNGVPIATGFLHASDSTVVSRFSWEGDVAVGDYFYLVLTRHYAPYSVWVAYIPYSAPLLQFARWEPV
jgi:hypothetical protein